MSLCMRWLYVVMLSGLCITTWWLEPRDCHFNVNIIEIGYRWRWKDVHRGSQWGEGVPGAGRGAIISCHSGISDFGATTMFSEMAAMATIFQMATTTMFSKWLPWQWNISIMSLQLEIEDDHGGLSAPRAIPYHAIINCLGCLSLYCLHPCDCAVVNY
jgi:hypothetical protein